jgi:hypothetical protein
MSRENNVYLVLATWSRKAKFLIDGENQEFFFAHAHVGAIVVAENEKSAVRQARPEPPEFGDYKRTYYRCKLVASQTKVEVIGTPMTSIKGLALHFDPRGPKMRELRKKFRARLAELKG